MCHIFDKGMYGIHIIFRPTWNYVDMSENEPFYGIMLDVGSVFAVLLCSLFVSCLGRNSCFPYSFPSFCKVKSLY